MMDSPVRRAFLLLRQHPALIGGPWLGVCAASFVVSKTVQQVTNRMFPIASLRGSSYANGDAVLRAALIRQGAGLGVEILEYALKVVALALTILLVAKLAKYGVDTFSGAMERLRKVPAVTGTLLKLFLMVMVISVVTTLIAIVPLTLYVPWQLNMHGPHFVPPPRWMPILSADVGRLLFVLCVMPFFLRFVAHFAPRPPSGEDGQRGLLGRALGYGTVAVVAEVALALLMRPLQMQSASAPAAGALIQQSLVGLAANLITSLPTIVCVVAIVLQVMDAEEPVTEAEPA